MKYNRTQILALNKFVGGIYTTNMTNGVSEKNYNVKIFQSEDDNIYLKFQSEYSNGEGLFVETFYMCILPDGEVRDMSLDYQRHELVNFYSTLKPFDF